MPNSKGSSVHGPICTTEKCAAVSYIIPQLFPPNTDACDLYGEHFRIIDLDKCSIQFNLIEVVPLEGEKVPFCTRQKDTIRNAGPTCIVNKAVCVCFQTLLYRYIGDMQFERSCIDPSDMQLIFNMTVTVVFGVHTISNQKMRVTKGRSMTFLDLPLFIRKSQVIMAKPPTT